MDELQISGKRFISSRRIARDNGYTSDYIGQLIRGGKVAGQKVGRAWYVDAVSFDAYLGGEGAAGEAAPIAGFQPEIPEQRSSDLPVRQVLQDAGEARQFAREFPAPAIKVEEGEKKEAPVVAVAAVEEKKEKPIAAAPAQAEEIRHVPLHIAAAEPAAGLRYYVDESASLPEIRSNKQVSRIVAQAEDATREAGVVAQRRQRRPRRRAMAALAALGMVIFIFSAVVSSAVSLNLSISGENAAAVSYSMSW